MKDLVKTYNEYLGFEEEFIILFVKVKGYYYKEFKDRSSFYVSNYSTDSIIPTKKINEYLFFEFTFQCNSYKHSVIEVCNFDYMKPDKIKKYIIKNRKDFSEFEKILNHCNRMQLNKKYRLINTMIAQA